MIQSPTRLTDLHAFAKVCPAVREVTEVLEDLGFHLVFSMPAKRFAHASPLPAQYHYKDAHGTEVIYLAGKDANEEGRWMTPHASRFWLYAGSSQFAYTLAMRELKSKWGLTWGNDS